MKFLFCFVLLGVTFNWWGDVKAEASSHKKITKVVVIAFTEKDIHKSKHKKLSQSETLQLNASMREAQREQASLDAAIPQ